MENLNVMRPERQIGVSPVEEAKQIRDFTLACGSWSYVAKFATLKDLSNAAHMYLNENKVWNGREWIGERRNQRR